MHRSSRSASLLMAGATILVAAVLSVLNIRTTNTAIDNGIRDLAEATTPRRRRPMARPCASAMPPRWRRRWRAFSPRPTAPPCAPSR
jgi:hypothetical protein